MKEPKIRHNIKINQDLENDFDKIYCEQDERNEIL